MNAHSLTPVGLTKTLHECYMMQAESTELRGGRYFHSPAEGVRCSSPRISPAGTDNAVSDETRSDTSSLTLSQFSTLNDQ